MMKTSWKEVSIEEFKKIRRASTEKADDPVGMSIAIAAILSDSDPQHFYSMTVHELASVYGQMDFVQHEPVGELKEEYEINGKKYACLLDPRKMTASQYIDFMNYIRQSEENLAEVMSVFLTPEGKNYGEGYRIEETIEEISAHFNIADAKTLMFFFTHLLERSIGVILTSSIARMKNRIRREKDPARKTRMKNILNRLQDLTKNGVGLTSSTS